MHEKALSGLPAAGACGSSQGIHDTIVDGRVLLEEGQHTGALPGRVLRNARFHANRAWA